MFKDFLKNMSQASYVELGYGQVEPNHLSAQRTGQIYAQLPAKANISKLEQGQFVKYDYAANANGIGEVNFTGAGEWMMVFNEIKLYRTRPDGTKQSDCEFVMLKDDYQARIYSPYDYEAPEVEYNGRYLNGKDSDGNTSMSISRTFTAERPVRNEAGATVFKSIMIADTRCEIVDNKFTYKETEYSVNPETGETTTTIPVTYAYDDVTKDVEDIYEMGFTNDPYKKLGIASEKKMPAGTAMVPRVIKTNVGDIYTTNTINATVAQLTIGTILTPAADGILAVRALDATEPMQWQVVKIYTMPDGQRGVKLMRIA